MIFKNVEKDTATSSNGKRKENSTISRFRYINTHHIR